MENQSKKGELYSLTCNVTGKKYIGQAVQLINNIIPHGTLGRWKKHTQEAMSGSKRCRALNNAINKYGSHNFTVRTLLICEEKQMDYYEKKFIRQYNTTCPNGYNIRSGGSRGRHHPDTIEKIRKAKSGVNNHMYGKHHTDEAKKKISMGNTGKVRSSAYRKKMSETKGRIPENACLPMYIYPTKKGKFVGYVVKYHPSMTQQKKSFSSTKYTMEEKLQQAINYLKSLEDSSRCAPIPSNTQKCGV